MPNQRTYTIEIAGVKESYESVSKLADVLDKLTDKTVKVSTEVERQSETIAKNTKESGENSKAKDELGKATKKLREFDAEYEKELQRVKSELSSQKKEVSELIKQEEAASVVEAKQLNSYADKQKYLTSLNKLIRTHANVTDEDKAEIMEMVQESAKLQAELKAFDEEMKIYTRNVGNYPGAAQMVIDANKTMKQELRELTNEMANMLANGVDKTDPKFQSLAKRAGEIKDAFSDAKDEISHFASDTRSIDNVINLAQTATSVWGLYSNAMQAFGVENEEVTKSMQKMMAVMSTLQQLQTLQNALTAQGSATMKVYETVVGGVSKMLGLKTAATQADTVATNTSTVATKALSVALRSIPLMFVIGLVITLITQWESIVKWFKDTFPVIDKLSAKFKSFGGLINTLKATLVGFGKALVEWVTNPVKTLAQVLERLFAMDFKGAYQALGDGLSRQFKGSAEAFKKGFQQQVEKGLEDITLKSVKEENKQTQQQLAELKIRERNNKSYSKKYIELQKKDFEERKKLAKGNQEELDKIKLEEMQFEADIEDKKTAYAKEQQKQRVSNAKSASKQIIDAENERQKELEQLQKKTEKVVENSNNVISQGIQLQRRTYDELYKELINLHTQLYGKEVSDFAEDLEDIGKEELKEDLDDRQQVIEQFLFRRKMLIYQSLAEEAQQTKETYKKLSDDITVLIDDTTEKLKTATGEEKKQLEKQLAELQRTFENVRKTMESLMGDYAENNDFTIPLTFDTDAIIERFNEMVPELSDKVQKIWESHGGINAITDFLKDTGNSFDYLLTKTPNIAEQDTFRDYLISIVEVLNGDTEAVNDLKNALQLMFSTVDEEGDRSIKIFGELPDSFVATKKAINENGEVVNGLVEDLRNLSVGSNIAVDRLNVLGQEFNKKWEEISTEVNKGIKNASENALKEVIDGVDKEMSYNEKILSKFRDATKGIKFDIVNVDDALTSTFGGQIMSIEKTREQYENLKDAYEEYLDALEDSRDEEIWKTKINAIRLLYGEESKEYQLILNEKEKADAEYLIEYERVQSQIRQIDKKTNEITADYAKSLGNRIQEIYKALNENLFKPLADGFTAVLDYQIEEAEKRLEDVEKLLDKAVELREDSEQKIEEINDKLKESDQGNTESLKQQLADEMVLLVQRQQNERDLQKQKEREEALIQKKEKQNRKIELGQKLIEGIVNTAVGITAALKYGPILGPIFAAVIGAMGAVQTAIITKQISKLEKGGLLNGKSHKQGGMRVEGTNIEVEGGEFVVNKKSTTKYINLIEAINEDNPLKVRTLSARYDVGGKIGKPTTIINNYNNTPLVSSSIRKFADGGRLDYNSVSAVEQNREAYRVAEAIDNMNFNPVVSVVDIQKKTNSLTKVMDLAGK